LTFLTQPAQAYAQDWRDLSADVDGDGLPNAVEQNGWYNASGGPYQTDDMDNDSDDDGLTDGQEKLFDTDPFDDHSPGMYVEYQEDFQTKQYYPWQQYGDHYIALPSSGKDAVVVRRGTTFSVGGPADADLQISKSRGSLTTLEPIRDQCGGRWTINVPSGGTVGIYTLTLRDGSWRRSLDLYVIFQLPDEVSTAFKNAFVYDDNPNSDRDTTSIGYWEGGDEGSSGWRQTEYTHYDYSWIPIGQWITHGYTWGFRTQHYDPLVFKNQVMPAINGTSNTWDAANALGQRVDELTCTNWPNPLGSSYCVMNPGSCFPYKYDNQCTNIANLLTAFNRSAGIPARPMWTDWIHSTFDHSTEVWTQRYAGSSYRWYVMRGYLTREGNPCTEPQVVGGYRSLRSTSGYYSGDSSQGVYAVGENWNNIGGSSVQADKFRLASWDLNRTARTGRIVKKDWFESRFVDYWNWPSEPRVTGSPPGAWPSPPSTLTDTDNTALDQDDPDAVIQFGQILADYATDLDNDGRFDELVFEFQVDVAQAGEYWIRAKLAEGLIETVGNAYLEPGSHTLALAFDGRDIYMNQVDGPFTLDGLWATDVANPMRSDFGEFQLAHARLDYQSSFYRFSDFGLTGARLSGSYQDMPADTDGDGFADALIVETDLDVERPDTYTVQGLLFDGEEELISEATWTGSGSRVTLQFEGLRGTSGPYTLQHVHVRDAAGEVTDGMKDALALGERPEFNAKPISLGAENVVAPLPFLPNFGIRTDGYSDAGVDTDGDGSFDQLVITVGVDVEPEEAGQPYRIEGWLVDGNNALVSWAVSDSKVLTSGVQSLTLAFDGRVINERGVDGPFTLVALKALAGDAYDVLDEVDVAHTTSAYNHDQFEGAVVAPAVGLFHDNMENGAAQWVAESPWELNTNAWHGYSHAWEADASGTLNGALATIPLDVSDYANPALRFNACYAMESVDDVGYLEVSTNGVDWTRVTSYTDATTHWTPQLLQLGDVGETPNFQLRFNADSESALSWYVDDVSLIGWPAVTSVSFTYSPQPVLVGQNITFEGSYSSLASTPVTYTWDFGDGSPAMVTYTPATTHQFLAPDDYDVQLTVENPYDATAFSQTITAYQPVTGTSFNYAATDPTNDRQAVFTATYAPVSATQPVTYTWEFDDGSEPVVTASAVVTHEFPANADYNVALTAYNGYGGPATYQDVVRTPLDDDRDNIPNGVEGVDDADGDGTPNYLDLDADGDTVHDSAEAGDTDLNTPPVDTDDDGTPDYLDLDADGDTIRDSTEAGDSDLNTPPVDTDDDGTPDFQDLDADGDDIPDRTEAGDSNPNTPPVDTDDDGTPDFVDSDSENDGIIDAGEWSTGSSDPLAGCTGNDPVCTDNDADGDGKPNYRDTDSDADLISDNMEGTGDTDGDGIPNYLDTDSDGDGAPDEVEGTDDSDGDGIPDYLDNDDNDGPDGDADGDTILNKDEDITGHTDADGDGTQNKADTDSDNDGIPDSVEAGDSDPSTPPIDSDGDGLPDFIDTDSDHDGIPDAGEWSSGSGDPLAGCTAHSPVCTDNDADDDGTPNYRDTDSDDDGAIDLYEGTRDLDSDGIADFVDADSVAGPENIIFLPLILR